MSIEKQQPGNSQKLATANLLASMKGISVESSYKMIQAAIDHDRLPLSWNF